MIENQTNKSLSIDVPSAVSPAALARRWDCCRQTIYNMIDNDQLHSFKVRNRRLIPFSEIERIERGNS